MHNPNSIHRGKAPINESELFQPLRGGYPPVNTMLFTQSIKDQMVLMQQANLLLNHLGNQDSAYTIMEYAQQGQQATVDHLIASIEGLDHEVKTRYTPTGVVFTIMAPDEKIRKHNCTISIRLQWGK